MTLHTFSGVFEYKAWCLGPAEYRSKRCTRGLRHNDPLEQLPGIYSTPVMDRFSQRAKSKPKVYILYTVFEQLSDIDKFICCFLSKKKEEVSEVHDYLCGFSLGFFLGGGCKEFFKTKYYPPRNLNLYIFH